LTENENFLKNFYHELYNWTKRSTTNHTNERRDPPRTTRMNEEIHHEPTRTNTNREGFELTIYKRVKQS